MPKAYPILLSLASVSLPGTAAAQSAADVFAGNCQACHQATGLGIKGTVPSLRGAPTATGAPPEAISRVLKGKGVMPRFQERLNDAQIAAVLTYIRSSWGNRASAIRPAAVAAARAAK